MSQFAQAQQGADLKVVEVSDLPEYPIDKSERLDSHFYMNMHYNRWLNSEFHLTADLDVQGAGFTLFCIAQNQAPVGTLPRDDRQLSTLIGVSLEQWKSLKSRDPSPLYKWSECSCNGEIRLAHPVVTDVAVEALHSRRVNQANTEARKRAKRVKDLKEMLEQRIGAGHLLKNSAFVDRFNDWMEDNHPDTQRRESFVRQALDEFCGETG